MMKAEKKQVPLKQNIVSRETMLNIDKMILKSDNVVHGDDCCPLVHKFADGCYIREIHMKKGLIVSSKIHKTTHPYFLMKGKVEVITEDGIVMLEAPYSGITKAGTKRILYMHEDTIWTTVHVTDKTDLKEIEEDIIAKTFDELPENKEKLSLKGGD